MIKSAILFGGNVKLKVIVIADLPLINGFEEKVSSLDFACSMLHSFFILMNSSGKKFHFLVLFRSPETFYLFWQTCASQWDNEWR